MRSVFHSLLEYAGHVCPEFSYMVYIFWITGIYVTGPIRFQVIFYLTYFRLSQFPLFPIPNS